MRFAESEIRQITESVWTSVLEMELQPGNGVTAAGMKRPLAACEHITGGWEMAVVLYCPAELAERAATVVFDRNQDTLTNDDIQDVMCELVNIIAGNIKGMLHGTTYMSLPTLVQGVEYSIAFPRHLLLSQVSFDCEGQPVLIMLLGEDKEK